MARWIPALATIGLVSLMLVPLPGLWGLLIGVACCLAIGVSALLWLVERIATRLAGLWRGIGARRRVHAGSGMLRKAGAPPPAAAPTRPSPPLPSRPSPVRMQAGEAALRRTADRLELFRLRLNTSWARR